MSPIRRSECRLLVEAMKRTQVPVLFYYGGTSGDSDTMPSWARVRPAAFAAASGCALAISPMWFMNDTKWIMAGIGCSVAVVGFALILGCLQGVPNAATLGACVGGTSSFCLSVWFLMMIDAGGESFGDVVKTCNSSAVVSSMVAIEMCRRSETMLLTFVVALVSALGMAVLQMGCICMVHPNVAWALIVVGSGAYLAVTLNSCRIR
jgi:hypothetical protein